MFCIPEDRRGTDVEYLITSVRKEFKVADGNNIVLQRYTEKGDLAKEYMDEDCEIADREWLKAIIVTVKTLICTSVL